MLADYHSFKDSIGKLNALATKAAEKKSLCVKENIPEKSSALLSCFQKHGAITYYDDREIRFKDESGREFCRGFWLEDYVYLALTELKDKLQDYACSITIESSTGTKNEIDAAFLLNNRLHLIECKTANLRKNADALYKIDSIHSLAGLRTKPILVSYRPLDSPTKQRARDLCIQVFEGQGLKTLSSRLRPDVHT